MQGGFGLAAANVSHGALNVTGKNNIKVDGGTLDTTTLNISNSDDSKVNINSKGVTVSAGRAIGVLIAEGSFKGSNEIEIDNATLKGNTISIKATAAPEVNVDALALSAGAAFAGSGLFAGSINDSAAKISASGATFTGDNLNINAENLSTVKTSTGSASGSLLASGSLTGILNNSNAAAAVDFQNATVNAPNTSVNVNSSPSQKVGLVSLGAGGLLAATGSIAGVISNPSATANMSAKEITADDLKITATADSNPEISVKGLTVGAIASGSNLIISARDVKVDAALKADSASLNNLNIDAKTASAPNLNVNGDGGGLVGVSPAAAVLKDNLTQSGSVNVGGTLNVKNSLNVNAKTSDAGIYKADALGAAVIGASGVELKRSSDSNAAININNANIQTAGEQNYTATNELGYKLDLEAAGYGGLNASAGNLENKTNYAANINVSNSKLKATSESSNLTFDVQTSGNASSLNDLKAAGAVETVISNSDVNTIFDNQINLNSSTLTTEGNESAIKLATSDTTEQKYHTIANIQGGAFGIGVANTNNTLTRSNAVKLTGSTIDAANNVYLLSGENVEGVASKLTMTAFADVYNKTALPLSTAPELKDNLKINNTVDINSGSTISAVRNVNIKAESGTEVVTESAKEYNIYTGESGKGKVIVTTGHEGNAYETANNFVNIDGTINAGIRSSLNMTISGGDLSENVNPTVTLTEGADIFDPSAINFSATSSMENPFLADYNKAVSDMQAYTPGSAEYVSLYNQVLGMEKVMATYGFAEKIGSTEQYIVYDKIDIPAMELPNIELAGGNIDISTPNLKGNGTLNANAAKELTINNKTERSLIVNDLTMDTAGGRVYLNDISTTQGGNLKFNTQSDYTPTITINNTRGLQNVGEDPMYKYTFGNQKFSDWLQETIVTKNTSWFDGYKKDSSTETLTFKNYEHYLNFVYNMALKYDTTDKAAQRQYLSDAAGNSSWYKGNFNDDWTRWKNLMLAKYNSASTAPAGSIVSGGAVSVIAKTLNINGLIQSGFNNYVAEVNTQAITKLQRNGSKKFDNDAVIGDKRFKVNSTDAETVYNSKTGVYDKVVGLYYNPKTNSVLTDPLQVNGGVIYLKAQDIVSTGNGKIVAAGGGADININNSSYTPLVVKNIDTTGRPEPLVMINGVDYTKKSQYLPNSKAVYAWTGGINYKKIETKYSETTELFWGLAKIKTTADLVNKLNTEKVSISTISTSIPPKEGSNLQSGVFTDYSGSSSLFSITTARESGKKVYGETSVSKIISSKVSLNAGENIDVTLGLPENKTTELKVTSLLDTSRIFDVKINANTPLNNVDISGNKNVNIIGLDDVSGKINAKNLDITTPGNINITTQLSDTLTAQGDKSVTVTQTSGDIKIGKIASKGNVNLTAQNGAIVNSVDTALNMTGSADKISAWQAAGLISNKDSANSATNSAKEEKATRLAGLENLFKRWALKDDGTIDETLYNQFINNTADRTKLADEQIIQMEIYQTLQTSTNYGFSKNQLLYAVQESLFNPSAGITASISDPIITGKNITLNAKSFGKELEPVTYSDLTNIKTLEKLAGVKGGDVTINENGSVTVKAQSPITIAQSTTQDKLNITTQGNTFLSGTANTKFNVNTPINARNNKVMLMTGNGIDASKGISAKDIELYAGAGEINAKIVSGTLTANALDDITINADTTLPIKNVTSNEYAIIKANGNIVASDKNSLIRSTDVELTATNNIGTQSLPLTIFSEVMLLNAKHVYVYDGDPAGSEDGEDSGNSSGGSSSKGGNSHSSRSSSGGNRGYSNFASNPSSFATLGTAYTSNGLTNWKNASNAAPSYSFSEFESANDLSYRQTRNYFEVKFIPTWFEKEYMSIDFDYSFDNFGTKNATADELTIE